VVGRRCGVTRFHALDLLRDEPVTGKHALSLLSVELAVHSGAEQNLRVRKDMSMNGHEIHDRPLAGERPKILAAE
jgi:hypothetical protein